MSSDGSSGLSLKKTADQCLLSKRKIVTLGINNDSPTCSMLVAKSRYKDSIIVPVPTFEDGATIINRREADTLLIPAAYPYISKFLMDEKLSVTDAFTADIPAIVFVTDHEAESYVDVLFYHPATESLLSKLFIEYASVEKVTSNEVAVDEMMRCKYVSAAVTNAAVADYHGLTIRQVLRSERAMGWLEFCSSQSTGVSNVSR